MLRAWWRRSFPPVCDDSVEVERRRRAEFARQEGTLDAEADGAAAEDDAGEAAEEGSDEGADATFLMMLVAGAAGLVEAACEAALECEAASELCAKTEDETD